MNEPSTKEAILRKLQAELPTLRNKYGVERMAVYGSLAKGSATATRDIDILVQLSRPLGFAFVRLAEDLESAMNQKVDLATFESLHRSRADPRRARIAADIERSLID